MNILEEIAEKTRERIEIEKQNRPLKVLKEEALALNADTGFPFEKAIKDGNLSFICEVKKASPSKGLIAEEFPYIDIAKEYELGGASAVSVLTEPFYFMGSDKYLKEIKLKISLPVLRKDFTVDEYMIYQAKVLGADAVLLICAILDDDKLKQFLNISDGLGLSALVEAHDEEEVKRAVNVGARMIGVNNRDLKTFEVDINNSIRLRKFVPENIIFVSESGIRGSEDISKLATNGTDGVLIGETVMRAGKDRINALRDLKAGICEDVKIKICGIRRMEDVEYANKLLPDYIGFILADGFSRQITKKQATEFAQRLDKKIKRVGVFVNQPVETVAEYINDGIIQYAQLHGDEDNEYINMLKSCTNKECGIIKAIRVKNESDIKRVAEYSCDYLLLDAYSEKQAGGSGKTFDWTLIKDIKKPFFLAGGLSSSNVRNAIKMAKPFAVDASSSMEIDGYKDYDKMKAFINTVLGGV